VAQCGRREIDGAVVVLHSSSRSGNLIAPQSASRRLPSCLTVAAATANPHKQQQQQAQPLHADDADPLLR